MLDRLNTCTMAVSCTVAPAFTDPVIGATATEATSDVMGPVGAGFMLESLHATRATATNNLTERIQPLQDEKPEYAKIAPFPIQGLSHVPVVRLYLVASDALPA